jgi:hypothetical protein
MARSFGAELLIESTLLQGCVMRVKLLTLCTLVVGVTPLAAQSMILLPTPQERIHSASLLPIRTAELREAGVSDTTVRRILDLFRVHQVDPVQADQVLVVERDAAREHGPTDNFGAFVQRQLAAGKRGRALSDAIRAEHRAHGHKHMKHKEKAQEKDNDRGDENHGPVIQRPPVVQPAGSDRHPN